MTVPQYRPVPAVSSYTVTPAAELDSDSCRVTAAYVTEVPLFCMIPVTEVILVLKLIIRFCRISIQVMILVCSVFSV